MVLCAVRFIEISLSLALSELSDMLFATVPPSQASVSSLQDQEQYGKDFLLAVDVSKSLYVSVSCSLWFY
jgi:hypothetical protein